MKKIFLIMLVLLLLGGCGVKVEDVVLPDMAEVVTESEDISFSGSDLSDEKEDVDITVDNVEKPKTEPEEKKVTAVQKKSEVKKDTSSGSKKKKYGDQRRSECGSGKCGSNRGSN